MPEIIRNNLKQVRHELGIDTKKEMAEMLNMTPQKYGQLEENKLPVSFKRGLKIAKKLKMPVEKIFELSEE